MLKLCITALHGQAWRWNGRHWTDSASTIEPFEHPMLEHAAVTDGLSTFIVVRERARGTSLISAGARLCTVDSPTYLRMRAEVEAWPLDFVLVECRPDGSCRIKAGEWGTAPLYLTETRGQLCGSWALADLRQVFKLNALDDRSVTRLLTQNTRYARETLFRSVYQLTERACAVYDDSGFSLRYPEPAAHATPRAVRAGVDVVEMYQRCVIEAVHERPFDAAETAVELSGGMDSASVAMALAERCRGDVLAYALAIGGDAGSQQTRRRAEMLRHLEFPDLTLDALSVAPFNPAGQRARRRFVEPGAEPYHEAVGAMLDSAGRRGVRTVFTGDGGDELLSLRGDEWTAAGKVRGRHADIHRVPSWLGRRCLDQVAAIDDDLAPQTVVNEATLLGFALRSPQFLDAGMWPVSPLCSPRLIRFAEQLPVEWRADKRVCREWLRRFGFSEDVVRPHLRENFRHVMQHGLREYGIPLLAALAAEAVTVDLGFVDGDELRAGLDKAGREGQADTMMFPVLSLELALRAMMASTSQREDAMCT